MITGDGHPHPFGNIPELIKLIQTRYKLRLAQLRSAA